MCDALFVKVSNGHGDLSSVELDNLFSESLLFLEHLIKFTPLHEGHNEIETELGLEQVVHSNKERMITRKQDIFLQLGIIDLVILEQHILSDGFNSIENLVLFELGQIDLTKSTSAKYHLQFEIFKLDIHGLS